MCEHKNLRAVGDRLFCKDCKTELPIEFLTKGQEEEKADVVMAADAVAIEPAVDVIPAEDIIAAVNAEEPGNDTPKKKPAKTGRKTAKKGA